MQKQVSKQSLAVLALSILLAISMALTATFAAFSATGSAKGVITFDSVGVTLTYDASQDAATAGVQISYEGNATAGNEVTVAFARAAFELNDDKDGFVLTSEAKAALAGWKVAAATTIISLIGFL